MSQLKINEKSPVVSSAEIIIDAPIEKVWNILTNFKDWPKWNKNVTKMNINDEVRVGTTFEWTAGGSKIVSVIEEIDEPNRIVWTGKTFGIKAMHIWEFKNLNGKTNVFTQESFDGMIAKIFKGIISKMLKKSLQQGLFDLKHEAESK